MRKFAEKSRAVAFQMAYAWARGLAAFGIEPIEPLNTAIVQSEDDDDEQRMFRDSMMRGYREFHGWTDDDFEEVDKNGVACQSSFAQVLRLPHFRCCPAPASFQRLQEIAIRTIRYHRLLLPWMQVRGRLQCWIRCLKHDSRCPWYRLALR